MSIQKPPDPVCVNANEDAVARAALVVLRALSRRVDPGFAKTTDRVQIQPDQRVIDDREAARRIMELAKPIECSAMWADSVLQVTCSALAPEDHWRIDDVIRVREADFDSESPSEFARFLRSRSGRILVLGNGEFVPLGVDEFAHFERTLVFRGRFFVLGGPASEFGFAEHAADWVRWYTISHSTTGEVSG